MPFPGENVFPQYDYPCTKDCPERSWDCHGKCKRYLDAKAENDKKRQEVKHRAKAQDDYDSYRNNVIDKYIKEQRRIKKK